MNHMTSKVLLRPKSPKKHAFPNKSSQHNNLLARRIHDNIDTKDKVSKNFTLGKHFINIEAPAEGTEHMDPIQHHTGKMLVKALPYNSQAGHILCYESLTKIAHQDQNEKLENFAMQGGVPYNYYIVIFLTTKLLPNDHYTFFCYGARVHGDYITYCRLTQRCNRLLTCQSLLTHLLLPPRLPRQWQGWNTSVVTKVTSEPVSNAQLGRYRAFRYSDNRFKPYWKLSKSGFDAVITVIQTDIYVAVRGREGKQSVRRDFMVAMRTLHAWAFLKSQSSYYIRTFGEQKGPITFAFPICLLRRQLQHSRLHWFNSQ